MDAYLYRGALWCNDCIRQIMFDKDMVEPDYDRSYPDAKVALDSMMRAHGFQYEWDWDSDSFPKYAGEDGGGDADHPQHCDNCHCFLENPLTDEGYKYIIEHLVNRDGNPEVLRTWSDYYGEDTALFDGVSGERVTVSERVKQRRIDARLPQRINYTYLLDILERAIEYLPEGVILIWPERGVKITDDITFNDFASRVVEKATEQGRR